MVNGYYVILMESLNSIWILMESFLFELQDVTFCNKKTFLLLSDVIYTLLYKNVLYLWL